MTDEETARFAVLKIANDDGKFAIPVGSGFKTLEEQEAFQGLLLSGWLRLIDITPLAEGEPGRVYRVFLATPEAMTWFRGQH